MAGAVINAADWGLCERTMPSLFRFLFVVGLLAGAGYGALYALAAALTEQGAA